MRPSRSNLPNYFEQHRERVGGTSDPAACFVHIGLFDDPDATPSEAELGRAQLALHTAVVASARIDPGGVVLDVGCGFGASLALLRRADSAARLIGVNIDPSQLQVARRIEAGATWLCADASALPLAAASVDRVLCVEAAFHFGSRRAFAAEAARVLRPGGLLVLTDFVVPAGVDAPVRTGLHSPGAVGSWSDAELVMCLRDGAGPWPDPWCTEGSWPDIAREQGMVMLEQQDWTARVAPTWRCILGSKELTPTQGHATDRAVFALAELLGSGRLRAELRVFTKS